MIRHSPTFSWRGRLTYADRRTIAARRPTRASAQLISSSTADTADGKAIRGSVETDLRQLAERTEPFHTWFLVHPTLLSVVCCRATCSAKVRPPWPLFSNI